MAVILQCDMCEATEKTVNAKQAEFVNKYALVNNTAKVVVWEGHLCSLCREDALKRFKKEDE